MEYLNTKCTLLGIKSFLWAITCVWCKLGDMDFRSTGHGAGGITARIQVCLSNIKLSDWVSRPVSDTVGETTAIILIFCCVCARACVRAHVHVRALIKCIWGKEMGYTVCNLVDSLWVKMDGTLESRNVRQTYDMRPCCASPFCPPGLLWPPHSPSSAGKRNPQNRRPIHKIRDDYLFYRPACGKLEVFT